MTPVRFTSRPAFAGACLALVLAATLPARAQDATPPAPAVLAAPDAPAAPTDASRPDAALAPLPLDLRPAAPKDASTSAAPSDGEQDPVTPLSTLIEANDAVVRADLWDRVRAGFSVPDLDDDYVRKWEQYYASKPDYMRRMTERGGRYLYHIIEEVEKRGMPAEMALLPFVESAFNPQAMSTARASGMWQFMPATGRDFRLRQNLFRDDRRSVLASTRAALDYLQQLHRTFGDWQHALAAYNWGQGNVKRAVARNQAAGQSAAYVSLAMPDETRNYVPKLQAIKNIVARPEAFNVALPRLENHPYFVTVAVERDIDVAVAARLAGMSLDDFQQLNPQMNKPVILAAGTPHLVLPFDNAKHFAQEMLRHRGPFATWTAWVAPRTVKPSEAARTVGMNEASLREVNHIPPRMLVKAGSTLLVPRAATSTRDVSERVADTASIQLAPEPVPGRRKLFKASGKGETVAAMAKRLRVPAVQLARWNGTAASGRFKPGQTVVVMLSPIKGKALAKGQSRVASKTGARRVAAKPAPKARIRLARR